MPVKGAKLKESMYTIELSLNGKISHFAIEVTQNSKDLNTGKSWLLVLKLKPWVVVIFMFVPFLRSVPTTSARSRTFVAEVRNKGTFKYYVTFCEFMNLLAFGQKQSW